MVSVEEEVAVSSYLHISVIVMFLCLFVNPFGVICGIAALSSSCLVSNYYVQYFIMTILSVVVTTLQQTRSI